MSHLSCLPVFLYLVSVHQEVRCFTLLCVVGHGVEPHLGPKSNQASRARMKSSKIMTQTVSLFFCFLNYFVMVTESKLSHSGGGVKKVLSDETDYACRKVERPRLKERKGSSVEGDLDHRSLGAPLRGVTGIQIKAVWKTFPVRLSLES